MMYEGRHMVPIRVERTGGVTSKVIRKTLNGLNDVITYLAEMEEIVRPGERVEIHMVHTVEAGR